MAGSVFVSGFISGPYWAIWGHGGSVRGHFPYFGICGGSPLAPYYFPIGPIIPIVPIVVWCSYSAIVAVAVFCQSEAAGSAVPAASLDDDPRRRAGQIQQVKYK